MVSSGLNIEGRCTDTSCSAYGRRVICRMYYGAFNITTDKSRCPMCSCTVKAITCGFSDCEWMYKGRKKGSEVNITSEWNISGDEYERFHEAGNMIDWEVLIIEAKKNPLPRPQCAISLHDMDFLQEARSLAIACGCRFHSHCVAGWETRETHCPTCRLEMLTLESPTTSFGYGEIGRAEMFRESPTASVGYSELGRAEIFRQSPTANVGSREMGREGRSKKRNRFRRLLSMLGLVCI